MHPDVRGREGDKCPQCGMMLVRAARADYAGYLVDLKTSLRVLRAQQKARARIFVRDPHTSAGRVSVDRRLSPLRRSAAARAEIDRDRRLRGSARRPPRLARDTGDKIVGDTRVTLTMPQAIAGREQLVTFELHDAASGAPVMFPREGDYRMWVQFQRRGEVLTSSFTVPVLPSP
jgi:hypothetical protein